MITPEEAEKEANQSMINYIDATCTNALQNKYEGFGSVIVVLNGATKKACSDFIPTCNDMGWNVALTIDDANNWVMEFTAK